MEVDVDVEAPGEVEDAVDLARVPVDIRRSADGIGTFLQRRTRTARSAGIVEQALLREGAQSRRRPPRHSRLQTLSALEAPQAEARVDLDMRADAGRALHERALQRPAARAYTSSAVKSRFAASGAAMASCRPSARRSARAAGTCRDGGASRRSRRRQGVRRRRPRRPRVPSSGCRVAPGRYGRRRCHVGPHHRTAGPEAGVAHDEARARRNVRGWYTRVVSYTYGRVAGAWSEVDAGRRSREGSRPGGRGTRSRRRRRARP